ncbi:tetratricopeptide repeat protein [Candidatus Palauibacter sp.]|uniref:tetratricopeptide repeat protein n=1 Tax=Candidatus Palauibacter sp. TaxID=3101350 RepID=UPI003B5B17B8
MARWKIWSRNGNHVLDQPDYYEEGVQLVRQEFYHEALTSFRLSLKYQPQHAATLEQMAVVYTHIGLTNDAVRAYEAALEERPRSPAAHYGLAFLLLKKGARGEATRHLQEFLAHARSDREAPKHVEHARRTLRRLGGAVAEPVAH